MIKSSEFSQTLIPFKFILSAFFNANAAPTDTASNKLVGVVVLFLEIPPGSFANSRKVFSNINYSQERRSVFMESFNEKIKVSLDAKTFEKLVANKELYSKLVATPETDKK